MTLAWTDNSIITRWRHTHQSLVRVAPPSDNSSVITRSHAAYAFLGDTPIIVNSIGGPCQHGFVCGCKQWTNDINESN